MTDMANYVCVPGPLLVSVGRALHGEFWQTALARDLGHNSPRTMQRWAEAALAGRPYRVPKPLVEELLGLLEARSRDAPAAFEALRLSYEGAS